MLKTIYELIRQLLEAVEGVKTFDLYTTEATNELNDRRIQYPAVLMEVAPITFGSYLEAHQTAEVELRLHVLTEIVPSVSKSDSQKNTALDHLGLIDEIYKALFRHSDLDIATENRSENYIINRIVRTDITPTVTPLNKKLYDTQVGMKFFMVDNSAYTEATFVELTEQDDVTINNEYDK